MSAQVPVSLGELIDKITILEIKCARITETRKRAHVGRELEQLLAVWAPFEAAHPAVGALRAALRVVNETLWQIEDDIRAHEAAQRFDPEFVRLARAVYQTNDRRFHLKSRVNQLLDSTLVEQKQYVAY